MVQDGVVGLLMADGNGLCVIGTTSAPKAQD